MKVQQILTAFFDKQYPGNAFPRLPIQERNSK